MKKYIYIFVGLLITQSACFAAEKKEISFCEYFKTQIYVMCSKHIVGMTEQDILVDAAARNSKLFKACIGLNIGKPSEKNFEGHTPRSVAQLCGNEETLKILDSIKLVDSKTAEKIKTE